jgi:tagatose-1,6-bisphosphate aldolase
MTDPYRLGARRGLAACSSDRGTFVVLALDHRQNLRRELRPDAPDAVTYDEMVGFKRAVVRALSTTATGTLLDPEI